MDTVERVRKAAEFCKPEKVAPLPAGATTKWGMTAVLKPHQEEGVAWLIDRYNRGVNVILADEMGLVGIHTVLCFRTKLDKMGLVGSHTSLCFRTGASEA
jgi:hypothetical protein